MKFEIKHRWSGEVLFSVEAESMRFAVEAAMKSKANLSKANLSKANLSWANLSEANLSKADLSWANLSEADLSWANLSEADLSWANLSKANLSEADLSEADLSWANLSWANLSWANLSKADLSEANLSKADLSWANLSKANLSEANLSWANLSEANLSKADLSWANLSEADLSWANLSDIRNDMWSVLLFAIPEIPALKLALTDGKVDGSTYSGECACLCGTIANERKCTVENLVSIKADANRPIERFFLAIRPGNTPENNQAAKIAYQWIEEFEGAIKQLKAKA